MTGVAEFRSGCATLAGSEVDGVVFDMDGVATDTADAHAAAWKRLFDETLQGLSERRGATFRPFDADADYRAHVDGKPRLDGVRDFLASRGVSLPEGGPNDPPERETVHGLGARKNRYFLDWLASHRVRPWDDATALIRRLRGAGVPCAVISSSRNAARVLESAGIADLFDARVDGEERARLDLPGKPDPAVLLEAARRLGVPPARCAVVEDAVSGVEAGARGGFGLVIGVDRSSSGRERGDALKRSGANVVAADLADLLPERRAPRAIAEVPLLRTRPDALAGHLARRGFAVFLDYDGTLTDIVDDPAEATLAPAARDALSRLAETVPTALVSGRDLDDLRARVGLDGPAYAGSHGLDLLEPDGRRETQAAAEAALPALDAAERALREAVAGRAGFAAERKRFAIALHYRRAGADAAPRAEALTQGALASLPADARGRLRMTGGKRVFEIRPHVEWDKGRAVRRLLERFGVGGRGAAAVYVGDDATDEDAFRALPPPPEGLALVVRGEDDARETFADYALAGPGETPRLLEDLARLARGGGA